ncbi:Uncharacterised protein [Actinomyces slackii]|uniref:Uncharacterized protein n=3 Tax=Actinomyces slackii TaxID=52774 RepID=A0A3S4SJ64_9ACTO|nr:Uncharacterised protein [Actinomyces slackii]
MRAAATVLPLLGVLALVAAFTFATARPGPAQPVPSAATAAPASAAAQSPATAKPASTSDADTSAASGQVEVDISALAPEVIHEGEDLQISGTITNGTEGTISGLSLVAQVQERTEITTETLSLWVDGQRDTPMSTPAITAMDNQIAPGQQASFSLVVSADQLPLEDTDEWGPRGVQVAVTNGAASIAEDRSLVVWDSSATVSPLNITTVIPVTASAEELAVLTLPASQRDSTGPTADSIRKRVLGLLELAGDGVVLAIDPALTDALGIRADTFRGTLQDKAPSQGSTSGQTPSPTPSSAAEGASEPGDPDPDGDDGADSADSAAADSREPAAAQPSPEPQDESPSPAPPLGLSSAAVSELTTALTRAVAAGDVIALPWDDADTAALANTGQSALINASMSRTQDSALAAAGAITTAAWPASEELEASTLASLPQTTTTVIAPPGSMPVIDDLTYTASGATSYHDRTILLPDPSLSSAMSGTPLHQDSDGQSQLSDLDSRQLLRGQTAVISRQAPALGRDLVVVMDRQAASAADPQVVKERLASLGDTSWTAAQGLEPLLTSASQAQGEAYAERSAPPEFIDDSEAVSAETLAQAKKTAVVLTSIASVLSDPPSALGRAGDLPSVVSSASWRASPAARTAHLEHAQAAGSEVRRSLTASPSSTINIINSEANLPVRVASGLDQDVTVEVRLSTDNQRLQIPERETIKVPAKGQATVMVPVTAVGSGDVNLTVQVLAADGTQVGTPTTVHMRVRADWESVGTAVVGGVLVIILVAGVVRTVRRGRRTALAPAQETA